MREIFKKRYDCKCSECGKEFSAAPSIAMIGFGMNQGSASCPGCQVFLRLTIDPDLTGETMVSEPHVNWVNREKAARK